MSIKNLVFEGGGVKGIGYGGVVEVLDALKLLKPTKRVAGTSAGGITALLLCLGYTAQEISEIVKTTPFNKFKDDTIGVVRDLVRLKKEYGIYKGDYFFNWISDLIEQKTGKPDVTFKELLAIPGTKELYLTGTNLNQQRVDIFSAKHTPDMEIRLACRITMSIPLFFRAVELNGDIMVDGGMSYNYPIDIFDDICPKEETIGFRVDSKDEINAFRQGKNLPVEIEELDEMILAMLSFYGAVANREHLLKDNFVRTCFLDSLDIGTVEFDITEDRIEKLVASCRAGAETFFAV